MKTLKKTLAVILSVAMVITLTPSLAFAADPADDLDQPEYVLMNIPYDEFYQAELGQDGVDSISSATKNGKARNVNVNGASYHQSGAAATEEGIAGVMYPVHVSDPAALSELDGIKVTDEDLITYEMNVRGQTTTIELKGADALQESPDYSYYVLSEKPASYKELTIENGKASFAEATGAPETETGKATGKVTVGANHADVEIALSGVEVQPNEVSGVIVTTKEGKSYALHHVVNIWRGTEIGWNISDMDLGGQTITKIRYYLKDGSIKDYASDLEISEAGYVLMNIPYDEFYAAELGENGSVDAVSTATLKYANSGIAGGSYHDVDAEDADSQVKALGVTYSVFVSDMSKLDSYQEIKDEDTKTIGIVSGREKTITPTELTGKDTLFCAPDYSWYKLTDKPARYKTMNEDGSFSAVSGRATAVKDVSGSPSYYTHHGNFVEIGLNGLTIDESVSGVIVTFDDGSEMALPHVQGFWQKTQIGWPSSDAVAGKTITGLKFITTENVYTAAVEIPVKLKSDPITAAFDDANTVTVTGLPEDIQNPVAKVQSQVGRGETPVVIAENASVSKDGKIATDSAAEGGTTYAVSVVSDNYADLSAAAEYTAPEGEDFLERIKGDYQPLFEGATFNEEYDHYWHDYVAAVVGESSADDTVAYMKGSIGAKGYGEDNEAPNFFCGFTNDVETITFGGEDGKTVTFNKKGGSSVTRTYEYVKDADAAGKYGEYEMAMSGYLYKAQDAEENDPFTYLLMFPDTPDTTYHLEFRYAETEEDVENLLDGPYGYWVGSAIQTSALTEEDEDTLQHVISLFVVENLAEMTSDETKEQRKDLVGTWDFLESDVLQAYGFDSMYIELGADGTGRTYAAPAGASSPSLVSEYTFFAYDPDQKDGKDGGTYIAFNETEETVTPGEYEIRTINGKKALVFNSNEGEITYYLREKNSGGNGGSGNKTEPAPVPEDPHAAVCPAKKFSDVNTSLWYHEAIDYVLDKGLMNGTGSTTFEPGSTLNRAMLVTILWRQEGQPKAEASSFTDLTQDWYKAAVDWAAAEGIVKGMSETTFAPNDPITREQMAAILYRYAEFKGADVSGITELSAYIDAGSISDWAEDALGWAVDSGLMKGVTETTLQPQGNATRAQVAVLMQRLCENILK